MDFEGFRVNHIIYELKQASRERERQRERQRETEREYGGVYNGNIEIVKYDIGNKPNQGLRKILLKF